MVLFTGLFLYMYFLSMSVVHVVLRQEAAYKVAALESEIALLESTYIESQHMVSTHMARLAQFAESDNKLFINRTSPTLVFSER